MRLKLKVKQRKPNQSIPINYQYALSSFIYHTIETSSNEYSKWLHQKGYTSGNKKFKLFTFSMLNIPDRKIEYNSIRVLSDEMEFTVSMVSDIATEHFIIGMFENQLMRIYDFEKEALFNIQTVEQIPEPKFSDTTIFKTISPIVISKRTIYNGKESAYYMSPEEDDYFEFFKNNLVEKYKSYNSLQDNNLKLNSFKLIGEAKRKLIRIKENKEGMTDIRGYVFNFSLEGDTELIRLGYESGFGKSCSLGFGCASVIRK